jgi:hypothetical protein
MRKTSPGGDDMQRPKGLLSVRSALVLSLSALSAIGGGGLLFAAHRTPALTVLGGLAIFAGALKLLDNMIE